MRKRAQLTPAEKEFLRRSLLTGVSLGGTVGAAAVLRQLLTKKPEKKHPTDTLTLYLPEEKQAWIRKRAAAPAAAKRSKHAEKEPWEIRWPVLTGGALAMGGGAAATWALLQKLYDRASEHQLQKRLEKARREYLQDLFKGTPAEDTKTAAKDRRESRYSILDSGVATLALLSLLGAGSTAYLTKKFLQKQLPYDERLPEDYYPQIRRLKLETVPRARGEKIEEEDTRQLLPKAAAIALSIDALAAKPVVAGSTKVAAEVAAAKIDNFTEMIGRFHVEPQPVWQVFGRFPKVALAVASEVAQAHPVFDALSWSGDWNALRKTGQARLLFPSFVGSVLAEKALEPLKKPKPVDTETAEIEKSHDLSDEDIRRIVKRIRLEASDPQAKRFLNRNRSRIERILGDLAYKEVIR